MLSSFFAGFVILTFIARLLMVWLLTSFSGLKPKERLFLTAVGVRGAVPITLATYPAAMGLDLGHEIFNIVFFTVTFSMLVQGTTIVTLARKLGLLLKDGTSCLSFWNWLPYRIPITI